MIPVDQWIAIAATLINPAFKGDVVKALAAYRPHLLEVFPPNAFTALSARCVAEAERHGPVPDWGVVSKVLREYVRDFVPRAHQAALPPPEPPRRPNAEELAALEASAARFHQEAAARSVAHAEAAARGCGLRDVSLKGDALRVARQEAGA
jgi:hypothetical protein